MTNPLDFVSQVRSELKKVVWPSGHETVAMTVSVIIMSVCAMIYFFAADAVICFILGKIL